MIFNVYFKDVCNRTIFLYAGKLTNMFEKHTLHAYQWGIFRGDVGILVCADCVLILNKMIVFRLYFMFYFV